MFQRPQNKSRYTISDRSENGGKALNSLARKRLSKENNNRIRTMINN